MKKNKLLSLVIAAFMLFNCNPAAIWAESGASVQWAGAANYNTDNNCVTTTDMPADPTHTAEMWAYPLNVTVDNWGAYYAGQTVIAGDYLYATGGGKLHKVKLSDGTSEIISENAGSSDWSYDYLCYADGTLIVATSSKLEAFALDGTSLGSVSGNYGNYHPVQYNDGCIICNGFIYRFEVNGNAAQFTPVIPAQSSEENGSTEFKAIGGETFDWNSGVFLNGKFYTVARTIVPLTVLPEDPSSESASSEGTTPQTTSKTTVYAVNYKTGEIVDSYAFDDSCTTASNTQGGVAYDSETKRIFWGTYNEAKLHSIKINSDGSFDDESYLSVQTGQKTVCTPVISGGRVYLAGQTDSYGIGKISVHNASDLTLIYTSDDTAQIQSNPIANVKGGVTRVYVQGNDGHIYFLTDNGESGTVTKLAETRNYSGVAYPSAFEQIATDLNGNIYCYNESGYLFCFGKTSCEVPTFTTNLTEGEVTYYINTTAAPLTAEASVSDGGTLTYQWQTSADRVSWSNIDGETSESYTPPTNSTGTAYFRCVAANTTDDDTVKVNSETATIVVQNYPSNGSSSTLDYVYITVKGADGETLKKRTQYVLNESETAYSLLLRTGLSVDADTDTQYGGVYVKSIAGLAEFDRGTTSGWTYRVNGTAPKYSASLCELADGDYVEWIYVSSSDYDSDADKTDKDDKTDTDSKNDNSAGSTDDTPTLPTDNSDNSGDGDNKQEEASFTDVEAGSWYEDAVKYAVENGLFSGVSETEFAPSDNMTRAMLVTVLSRLENIQNSSPDTPFTDVSENEWYAQAVAWAAENGIAAGTTEDTFEPNADITREQLAVILYRYADLKGYVDADIQFEDISHFDDADKVSTWALDAVKWAYTVGLIKGIDENTLAPDSFATRAEVSSILMRFCKTFGTDTESLGE